MSLKRAALQHGKALVLCVNALTSFVLSALILRHGIGASSDSWYFWQGSVNLIEHGKYITMLGEPITGWPPFFSIFLALFQLPLSQTGWTLTLAMSVISGMVSAVWSSFVFTIFDKSEFSRRTTVFVGSLLFVVLFSSLTCRELLANSLLLFLLGILFQEMVTLADRPGEWLSFKKPLVTGLLLAVGMLIHNSTIIFTASISLVVFMAVHRTLPRRLLASMVIVLVSITPWLVTRHLMAQEGSHSISAPRYTFTEYLLQVPREMGVFFISARSSLVQITMGTVVLTLTLILWAKKPQSDFAKRHRILLGLALLSLLGHFVLFNLVWIDSAIGGRFTWFFALTIVPIFFFMADKRPAIVAVLLLSTVGVSGWRVAKLVWTGEVPALTATSGEESPLAIYAPYFLTSRPDKHGPLGAVEVIPPIFHWQVVPPALKDRVGEQPLVRLVSPGERVGAHL